MPSQEQIKKPDFWKPSVATDIVLFSQDDERRLRVLLITRGRDPFKDHLAFPGGFLSEDDVDLPDCALREMNEETGASLTRKQIAPLMVLSHRDRDPRQNRVISASYAGWVPECPTVEGADDAADADWVIVESLDTDDMAFDHIKLLVAGLEWLYYYGAPEAADTLDEAVQERLGVVFDDTTRMWVPPLG